MENEGRYFNYINEEIIKDIVDKNKWYIVESYITNDVRVDRKNETWLNIIIKNRLGV